MWDCGLLIWDGIRLQLVEIRVLAAIGFLARPHLSLTFEIFIPQIQLPPLTLVWQYLDSLELIQGLFVTTQTPHGIKLWLIQCVYLCSWFISRTN